jgi:predicted nucleic acid-binding protein
LITADTNIFVYASDPSEPFKQAIATQVILALVLLQAPIALQLVGELQNVLRRKLRIDARSAVERAGKVLSTFDCFPSSAKAVALALDQAASGRLSYWDALMLASAREAGCTTFITEDLQDGARPFGLEIVNPFGPAGPSPRIRELLDLT